MVYRACLRGKSSSEMSLHDPCSAKRRNLAQIVIISHTHTPYDPPKLAKLSKYHMGTAAALGGIASQNKKSPPTSTTVTELTIHNQRLKRRRRTTNTRKTRKTSPPSRTPRKNKS